MGRLGSVQRVTLEEQVYRLLRQAILNGRFRSGERLVQDVLAQEFGTSRIPVRDALRRLHQEGLVVAEEQGRYRVASWGRKDVEEIYSLRLLLEPEALRLALPQLSREDVAELEAMNVEMKALAREGNIDEYVELNRSFHFFLYDACGRRRLTQFIHTLWSGLPPFTPLAIPDQLARSNMEHQALLKAIRGGKADEAVDVLRAHISGAKEALLKLLEDKG